MSVSILQRILPKDILLYIGRIIHSDILKDIHSEFNNMFQIGVSAMITKNNSILGRKRKRKKKVFAYIDINSNLGSDSPRGCKFHELSKNIINIPEIKGWERIPFNYRSVGSQFFEDKHYEKFSPRIFCIRNGNKNVGILPSRYFYSKPIHPRKYHRFKVIVQKFIQEIPTCKFIRGGAL